MNAAALEQIWADAPESMIQYCPEERFWFSETEKRVPVECEELPTKHIEIDRHFICDKMQHGVIDRFQSDHNSD